MSERDWTVEQAAELILEGMLAVLDESGAADDDRLAPTLVVEAFRRVCSPDAGPVLIEGGPTAAEFRARLLRARGELARREAG